MSSRPQQTTQIEISRSFPKAIGEWNVGPPALRPGVNKPFLFGTSPFYFIDASNVSHIWNIKNASLLIRNASLSFSQSVEQETEWNYSIEYQIRSANVPILITIEHRSFISPGSSFEEQLGEIIVNYEAVRSQWVVPGSGLELYIFIRNVERTKGNSLSPSMQINLENNELHLNLERL